MIRSIALTLILFAELTSLAAADEWRPVEGKLMTRWAKDVSPEKPWPEYPRPQMVRDRLDESQRAVGLCNSARRPTQQPAKWDGKILVPFAVESALSGVRKARLARRAALVSPHLRHARAAGRRAGCCLHFGAVDWQCTVWVNGQRGRRARGRLRPFSFDITDALARDGENEIVARRLGSDRHRLPAARQAGAQARRHLVHGGHRHLADRRGSNPCPTSTSTSLKIVPDVDSRHRRASPSTLPAAHDSRESDGRSTATRQLPPSGAARRSHRSQASTIRSSGRPTRRTCTTSSVELLRRRQVVDAVDSYFGLRKIEVRKDDDGVNRLVPQRPGAVSIRPARPGLVAGRPLHAAPPTRR